MNILYGLPSEGMGHATRSKVIIDHLLKNHEVRVVTSDRAYHYMEKHFPGKVYEISGLHFVYEKGTVSRSKTVAAILKSAPRDLMRNLRQYQFIHHDFRPDLIISDFETFTFFFAAFYKIPIISVDNIQIISRCVLDIDIPKDEKENYRIAKNIIRLKVPNCRRYFITSFFNAEISRKNTRLVPPILRDEIIRAVPERGRHILVYQTSSSQHNLVDILKSVYGTDFIVYGMNRNEALGNVMLKTFSETGFIQDLASSRGVIANGGFSLLSEAVYLKKPVCSVPVKNQFEQYVNASYIEKLGYGRRFTDFSSDVIKTFLYDLDRFQEKLDSYRQDGNQETFRILDEALKEFGT